jgi:hypothetical protein
MLHLGCPWPNLGWPFLRGCCGWLPLLDGGLFLSAVFLSRAQSAVAVEGLPATKKSVDPSWFLLLVVPAAIAVTQAPWWWEAATRWGYSGSLGVDALVPVLALLAGWSNLRRAPRGRQLHDRPASSDPGLLLTIVSVVTALARAMAAVWSRAACERSSNAGGGREHRQ